MNDLLKDSFVITIDQENTNGDIEMGTRARRSGELGLENFFEQVQQIEKQYEELNAVLRRLQGAHEYSKTVVMKVITQQMEKDVDEARNFFLHVKSNIYELDKENLANRQKPGCGRGSAVDRTRTTTTMALKRKYKGIMSKFQTLRENIHEEHRKFVQMRVYSVTGNLLDEETIDKLMETGYSEKISQTAIQERGRDQIMEIIEEIQERNDGFRDLERDLLALQQVFLDMKVLVDVQGDMLDDIESQVASAIDYVQSGNRTLQEAKRLQKSSRKWMCIAVFIFLIIVLVIVVGVLKPWQWQIKNRA